MYSGQCNQCGVCCTYKDPQTGIEFRCENLSVTGQLGLPESSRCTQYGSRWLGMPITMKSTTSSYSYNSNCLVTYPRECDAVPVECSYEWSGSKPQPQWFPGYAPKLIQITE